MPDAKTSARGVPSASASFVSTDESVGYLVRAAFRRLSRDLEADSAGRARDQHNLACRNVSHVELPNP